MVTTQIVIDAPVEAVYATLVDGWSYAHWVRGAKRIREVDPDWPTPGSRFHHSIGFGPVHIRDVSTVVRNEKNQLVELEVSAWPGGTGRVTLELEPLDDARTHVTMHEQMERGPASWFDNPVQDQLLRLRNVSSLRKLKQIVEQRYGQRHLRPT